MLDHAPRISNTGLIEIRMRFSATLPGTRRRTPRRLDLHRLAGARVAALAGGTLDHAEMTEPHDLHFAALLERRGDGIEGGIDGGRRGRLGHAGLAGHRRDQFVLGHRKVLSSLLPRISGDSRGEGLPKTR